jgi:hypothetical protein
MTEFKQLEDYLNQISNVEQTKLALQLDICPSSVYRLKTHGVSYCNPTVNLLCRYEKVTGIDCGMQKRNDDFMNRFVSLSVNEMNKLHALTEVALSTIYGLKRESGKLKLRLHSLIKLENGLINLDEEGKV